MEARRGTAVARSCRLSQDPTVAAMQAGIVGYCSSVWLDDATRYDEFAAQGCFPGCLVGRSPRKRDTLPTSAGRTGESLGRTMLTKLVHRKRSWQLATSTGSSASRWHTVKFIPDGFSGRLLHYAEVTTHREFSLPLQATRYFLYKRASTVDLRGKPEIRINVHFIVVATKNGLLDIARMQYHLR